MYKKAGIVIAILLAIIAIVIFVIANAVANSENATDANNTQNVATTTSAMEVNVANTTAATTIETVITTTQAATIPSETAPIVEITSETTTTAMETTTESTTQQSNSGSLIEIKAETLPEFSDFSDVGTVVGRKIYAYNGQVVFTLVINTTVHGQIEYFTTLTNYNIPDGSRLELQMRTYKTSSSNFPSIISIKLADT